MLVGFIVIPLIGLLVITLVIIWLPNILKAIGLSKHVDATAQSFIKAMLFSAAVLFLVFNILKTIFQ